MQNTLWQTTIHQSLHTSVDIDGRCRITSETQADLGVVFTGSVSVASGSVSSLRSMSTFRLNGVGSLAGSAARATIANPSGLPPMTARWSKELAIAKPSDEDGETYQPEYQYDETIDQLTNRILDRWSHVPGPNRNRNRGAS